MSLIYRGTSSDDVKFNVTERRVYNAPAFDVTGIEVPGRSGDVLNSQERFKNKSVVYTGFIRSSDFPGDTTWERLSRGLRTIKAWVCGDAGKYHDLTDDYDPGFVRRAFVSGETAISEVLDRPDGATITITFMADPFMYEESDPIELPETGTASGAIASFEGVAAPLKSLVFSIVPKQSGSGDPSPSNICPISGWSQVDGKQSGVNLLDPTLLEIFNNSTYVRTPNYNTQGTIAVKPNTTYTLSLVPATGSADGKVYEFDESGNKTQVHGAFGSANTPAATFTTSATAKTISFYYKVGVAISSVAEAKPMLNLGSTATAYTAPTLTPITISLGQTVYGGTVDALNGKLTLTHAYESLDGTGWTWDSNNGLVWHVVTGGVITNGTTQRNKYIKACNMFIPTSWARRTDDGDGTICMYYGQTRVAVKWSQITSASDAATLFNGTPLQVVYELATPIEIDITPVSVSSLLGQNNIWASCGDTEVEYVEPTENPTEWPSKPRLEITMAGAGTLTVNGKTWSIGSYTGTLICDSEIMDWYDASNLKNSLVSGDGFPEFQPGENVITYTGGITKVVAKPRWRTL